MCRKGFYLKQSINGPLNSTIMKNIIFVIALAFLSASSFGQKVNFSGEWKLNEEKSELGDQFSLAPQSLKIVHTKKTLDLEKHAEMQGQELYMKDSKLVVDMTAGSNFGEMFETYVFDKQ